jgi:hypothetical protein
VAAHTVLAGEADRLTAAAVPVEVQLVMPGQTLLGDGDEPAELVGAGPVPAGAARDLVRDPQAPRWLRRVYARPADGSLVAMDSTRRRFPNGLRRLLAVRDRTCRTPRPRPKPRHAKSDRETLPTTDRRRLEPRASVCTGSSPRHRTATTRRP